MATVAAPVVKASAAVAVKASAPRIAPAQPNAMQVRGMPSSATQGESLRIAQARHRVFTHREQLFIALAAAIRSLEAVPFPACVAVQQRVGGAILPGGDRIMPCQPPTATSELDGRAEAVWGAGAPPVRP